MENRLGITVEQAGEIKRNKGKEVTNLELMRRQRNLSQSQLANITGVSIRLIQGYEQKAKDINRAHFDDIIKICLALKCGFGDILEDDEIKSELYAVLDRYCR